MFGLAYHPDAVVELRALRAFDRTRILAGIREHLEEDALVMAGLRKRIERPDGSFIYQLRVGAFRVFYDVVGEEQQVIIRHIRQKGRRSTEEIL